MNRKRGETLLVRISPLFVGALILTIIVVGILFRNKDGNFHLKYEGESYPAKVVEEMIEDMLQEENPYLDLDVEIKIETKEEE